MSELATVRSRNGAPAQSATVYIVDDDSDVRRSISILARTVGLDVATFSNAQGFLDSPGISYGMTNTFYE